MIGPRRLLLEVIVQTEADAAAAEAGGADRLEVVRAIREGGLTPSVSLVRAIARRTSLPLRVMVRVNPLDDLRPGDRLPLQRAAAEFSSLGVDGLVAGFASAGAVDRGALAAIVEAAPGIPLTFHRAFDALGDPLGAIDVLRAEPAVDRLLTSGGSGGAGDRLGRLRVYAARAEPRLTIIAGGGVDEAVLAAIVADGCVGEVHVGRAVRDGADPEGPVSSARVRRLRRLADSPPSRRPDRL